VLKNHSLHHLKHLPIMLVFSILDKKCWGHCPNAWFTLTSINILSFLDTLLALRHMLLFPSGFVSVLQCMHSWSESSFYFSHWADQPFLSLALAMCKRMCSDCRIPQWFCTLCIPLHAPLCALGFDVFLAASWVWIQTMRLWDYCFLSSSSSLFALH
jgi:hypothetical protein